VVAIVASGRGTASGGATRGVRASSDGFEGAAGIKDEDIRCAAHNESRTSRQSGRLIAGRVRIGVYPEGRSVNP